MAKIIEIERYSLSDGGSIRITKLGRYYNFDRLYNSLSTPPDCINRISKAEAYRIYTEALKADVLEL